MNNPAVIKNFYFHFPDVHPKTENLRFEFPALRAGSSQMALSPENLPIIGSFAVSFISASEFLEVSQIQLALLLPKLFRVIIYLIHFQRHEVLILFRADLPPKS